MRIALALAVAALTMPAALAAQVADYVPEAARGQAFELSIRQIMRGPENLGEEPTDLRWTDDGEWLYFRWRPGGRAWDEERELYRVRVSAAAGAARPEIVPEGDRDSVDVLLARGGTSPDRATRAVSVDGDLYLVDRSSGVARRLTHTRATERDPSFTRDGRRLLYREGDNLFALRLSDGAVTQITDVRTGAAPGEEVELEGRDRFLEDQQLELFDEIRRQAARRDSTKARDERRSMGEPEPFYIPNGERLTTLDPASTTGHVLIGLLKPAEGDERTRVPRWITDTGYTENIDSRTKVGDEPGSSRMGLIDIVSGEVTWLEARPEDYEGDLRTFTRGWNEAGTHALVVAQSDDDEDRFVYALEASTGELTLLDHQQDDAWVGGPCGTRCMGWLPGGSTAYFVSEATGYSHLYTIEADGSDRRTLTSGDWEVLDVDIPEINRERDRFLLTTSEGSPFNRRIAWMAFTGGDRRYLTEASGSFEGTPSPSGAHMAVVHSTASRPPELFLAPLHAADDMRPITASPTEAWLGFPWIEPEIVRVPTADGTPVPARIYRPADLGAEPNGAGIIFVHGAGYLHNVHNYWSTYYREYQFHHFLAAAGYTVLDIDYRGSAGYGRDWRTAIYRHMGGKDLSDQVDGARYLAGAEGVDATRIGIYGGSYGGFITLMALFTAGETFRAGAALRSVTDWAHYNDGYTSNILNDPQEDEEAYRRSSPIYFAEGFRPDQDLLILHGMVDTNVHFSDVVRLAQRLIELGKENWEMAVYPAEGHGFEAPTAWTDEYRRIFELFERTLAPES